MHEESVNEESDSDVAVNIPLTPCPPESWLEELRYGVVRHQSPVADVTKGEGESWDPPRIPEYRKGLGVG